MPSHMPNSRKAILGARRWRDYCDEVGFTKTDAAAYVGSEPPKKLVKHKELT